VETLNPPDDQIPQSQTQMKPIRQYYNAGWFGPAKRQREAASRSGNRNRINSGL